MAYNRAVVFCSMALITFLIWAQFVKHVSHAQELPEIFIHTTTEKQRLYSNKTNETNHLKYILIWPKEKVYPFDILGDGQSAFIKHRCSFQNCYVTQSRKLFGGDVTRFNAIAFNGVRLNSQDLPKQRSPHQKYIYFNTESADNHPVCPEVFNNFFNWTATYRLDSDVVFYYLMVRDKKKNIIGPKIDMNWEVDLTESENKGTNPYASKTKAVAWFVSNCHARSRRKELATDLQKALAKYNYTVDIFGRCGTKKCPKNDIASCDAMLRNEYYFYMSAENSFSEDYVTEKVVTALHNDVVPIVYGGADYYRFLPPHSFINARSFDPDELADYMVKLINSPTDYRKYFRWKRHYSYDRYPSVRNICSLCEALNNKAMMDQRTEYVDFRKWWYPDYKQRCT